MGNHSKPARGAQSEDGNAVGAEDLEGVAGGVGEDDLVTVAQAVEGGEQIGADVGGMPFNCCQCLCRGKLEGQYALRQVAP